MIRHPNAMKMWTRGRGDISDRCLCVHGHRGTAGAHSARTRPLRGMFSREVGVQCGTRGARQELIRAFAVTTAQLLRTSSWPPSGTVTALFGQGLNVFMGCEGIAGSWAGPMPCPTTGLGGLRDFRLSLVRPPCRPFLPFARVPLHGHRDVCPRGKYRIGGLAVVAERPDPTGRARLAFDKSLPPSAICSMSVLSRRHRGRPCPISVSHQAPFRERSRAAGRAGAGRERIGEFFRSDAARKGLKTLVSDERIQGNPNVSKPLFGRLSRTRAAWRRKATANPNRRDPRPAGEGRFPSSATRPGGPLTPEFSSARAP